MTPEQIRAAAHTLLTARATRTRLAALPADLVPLSNTDAEAICEAMAQGLEQPIGGWKIGCTDRGMPAKQGLERPFCGQVPRHLIYRSGVKVSHAEIMRPVIEPEIVFGLGVDLPPRAQAYSRDDMIAAIAALHPGIEIPESRLLDTHPHGALAMVADQGYAGRIVLGQPVPAWHDLHLPGQAVTVTINGKVAATGCAVRAMGDPVEALRWLANYRSQYGTGLKAGQVVSTGTLTGVIAVNPGDRIVADFAALGKVELMIGE